MTEDKAKKKTGRPLPPNAENRKQFLAVMDADVIRDIKVAAAAQQTTASLLLEKIAREYLDRGGRVNGRKR
ncbi:hypothetical protein IVA98_31285 [Bradyrhizobium sp. 160]|uniref:hypothetical protein n=1 Tax=unclassified Bradyrhizobium TaxID=2631580 RepID=UPI001FFBE14C|nr:MULTISPECIES: hypothetical protein [unclassified Bradyrhizobium]MCK1627522.1 hypothetical protein [Bradyrhizobium sp. 160]UPK24193.1 hypothetical protein IVB26_22760 [Bradyrhizobium sp. 195]